MNTCSDLAKGMQIANGETMSFKHVVLTHIPILT